MQQELVWRQADDLAVVGSADRVVILDLQHLAEPPRILEGSAASIWEALGVARSTSSVVEAVAASFEVPAAEVEADVVRFLESLASVGLVEASGGLVGPEGPGGTAHREDDS